MQATQRPYDDPADTSDVFWSKWSISKSLLAQPKIHESLLAVKRKHQKTEWKFRTFRLVDDLFLGFSRKNPNQMKYIEFNKIICTVDHMKDNDSQFPYGFTLTYNGKSEDFRSKEQNLVDAWLQVFIKHCVFLDFEKKYKIMNKLGAGGYAKVYLTEQLSTQQHHAVKIINFPKQDKSKDKKKHRDMVLNEIVALKRLEHPNIVQIYSLFCMNNELCIVMEYIKGKKMIEDLKERGRYSERKAAMLAKQMLLTLGYIHEKNIIHRDLKPENILIDQTEEHLEVKLVDFGLAAFIGIKYQGFRKCGTAGFIAPEIFRDEPFSDQIDIFSLGVILYVCLCGKPPFKGKNYYDLLKKNYLCEYKFNFKYWHNVSEEAKNLVSRMMDPYPNSRITIKQALNHDWFKNVLRPEGTRDRPRSNSTKPTMKAEELLRPSAKGDASNNNSLVMEDSQQVPDLTQKIKSLIFSSPNLSGNKERLMKAQLPSFYQLSQVLTPNSRSMNELEKVDSKDRRNDDFLRSNGQSNMDLLSHQNSLQLKAIPSNVDAPYQIKNIEDIADDEADDYAENLQKSMTQYKTLTTKVKKPHDTTPLRGVQSHATRKKRENGQRTGASSKQEGYHLPASKEEQKTPDLTNSRPDISTIKLKKK